MTFISWNYQRGSRAEWGGSLRYHIPFPQSNKTDLLFFGLTAFLRDVCDDTGESGMGKFSSERRKIHSRGGSFHICACPTLGQIWLVSQFRASCVEYPSDFPDPSNLEDADPVLVRNKLVLQECDRQGVNPERGSQSFDEPPAVT